MEKIFKSKRAMSLFEVMITLCVSSLLMISIASTFYMFRVVNKSTIKNSQKELNMMSIKDYIDNNISRVLLNKIHGLCLYIDIDELGNDYALYSNNRNYYLVEKTDASLYESQHSNARFTMDLGDIKLYQKGDKTNPILNINGDYIVRVGITELGDDMHFFLLQRQEDGSLKEYPVHMFSETDSIYCDNIGESIYYSKLDDPTILEDMFSSMFMYTKGDTNILYMNIDGEDKPIFDNLEYSNLEVGLSIKSYTYAFPDLTTVDDISEVTPVPTYGIRVKTAIIQDNATYEQLKNASDAQEVGDVNISYVENGDYGIGYVQQSEFANDLVILAAKEVSTKGSEIKKLLKNDSFCPLDDSIRTDHIGDGTGYAYEFLGWLIDGKIYKNDITAVNKPSNRVETIVDGQKVVSYIDNPEKECVAIFNKVMTANNNNFLYVVDSDYRYRYCEKELYVIECNIKYSELDENNATEDKEISFATGVYYKYTPEVYTGE